MFLHISDKCFSWSSLITPTLGICCLVICWMWGTLFLSTVIIFVWMDFCTARVRILYLHLHLICGFPLIFQGYSHPTVYTFSCFIQFTSKPVHQYTHKTNNERQQVEMKSWKVFLECLQFRKNLNINFVTTIYDTNYFATKDCSTPFCPWNDSDW